MTGLRIPIFVPGTAGDNEAAVWSLLNTIGLVMNVFSIIASRLAEGPVPLFLFVTADI